MKNKLGWNESDEFHFKRNSDKIRASFLKIISKFDFSYYAVVIDKTSFKYKSEEFKDKKYFYNHILKLLFDSAKDTLEKAEVFIDEVSTIDFKNQLSKYLRKNINSGQKKIRKIKMQRSESNNLLQLADYIAGIISRSVANNKSKSDKYRSIIKAKEACVEIE